MAEIRAFKGILYNEEKVNLERVVAPPYDVISPREQGKYYNLSEYNVIRLILGKEYPGDNAVNNKYTRAATFFQGWLREGVLREDEKPAIYLYQQEYSLPACRQAWKTGERKRRMGFIALAKLEDFDNGKIFPHERTESKTKIDRLNLLRACKAHFCQILALYSDPRGGIDHILEAKAKEQPIIDVRDEDGVRHKLWRINEQKTIDKIVQIIKDKELYIADGHHRYETALNFRNEMRKKFPELTEVYDYVIMMLVNMDGEKLTILPIHRVVRNIKELNFHRLLQKIEEFFDLQILQFNRANETMQREKFLEKLREKRKDRAFGMYWGDKYYLLTAREEKTIDEILGPGHSAEWKKLDVIILHNLLFGRILGLKKTDLEDSIKYTIHEEEAIELINRGEYQIAFFLNPTKINQIKKIANNREIMPQKSTFFYPKLLSGLVMYKLE
ncbi:MAG: DUF1015 domain-containing protein [Actinomycetota bacterium]|nr:DUF1015 domain-containing protein [Actinomycetota bacterium]